MATVTKTIGTASRDYSTLTLWEADLDNAAIYTSGDDAVGEAYNDSIFIYNHDGVSSGQLNINSGNTIGVASVKLTVPESERHDGTYGTGTTVQGNGTTSKEMIYVLRSNVIVEWLSLFIQGYGSYDHGSAIFFALNNTGGGYTTGLAGRNMIIKGETIPRSIGGGGLVNLMAHDVVFHNNIVYDAFNPTNENGYGIAARYGGTGVVVNNCTVYNCGEAFYTEPHEPNNVQIKNTMSVGSVYGNDFRNYTNLTANNNLSSDSTALGTNSLINKSVSNQFISTLSGSEDLHLSGSSDAIDAGADLTGTVDGVEYDIDGQLRAGLWDIGADELLSGHIRRTLLGVG